MSNNFIGTYFPAVADLTAADLQDMRNRLLAWLQPAAPALDMRPGSVFGAWALDPLVLPLKAFEIAVQRWKSDMSAAIVAGGTVYDCDFVEQYLLALGGVREESVITFGHVRLEFSSDTDTDVPGGFRMRFNGSDVFIPAFAPTGVIKVRRQGTRSSDASVLPLTRMASGRYAVLLPVQGYATEVAAGDEAEITDTIDGLVAVTAVSDFTAGRQNNSVPEIARRASKTFHASGFATRGGIREQIMAEFPDIVGVSTIMGGDDEMLRSSTTALAAGSGAVDVVVRSNSRTVLQQMVKLTYYPDQEAVEVARFIGEWTPTAQPLRLRTMQWQGDTTVALDPTVAAQSRDDASAPRGSCSYSTQEKLWLVLPMPKTSANIPQITLSYEADGTPYAWFILTYDADPAISVIQTYADQEAVAGVNVLVRAPMQVVISRLLFDHTTEPGVLFNAEQATEDVEKIIDELFAPDSFNLAELNDAVYAAGAARIVSTDLQAILRFSVASKAVPADADDPEVDYAAFAAAYRDMPFLTLNSATAVNPVYVDPYFGTEDATLVAAGPRNIAYMLEEGALEFRHVT